MNKAEKYYDGDRYDKHNLPSDRFLKINSCGIQRIKNPDSYIREMRKNGRVDYSLVYLTKGILNAEINGEDVTIQNNGFILYPPHMPQDYCQRGSHTYYLRFTGTAADELIELAGLKGVYSYQLEKEEPRIRRLIEKIFSSTALNKNETEAETIANLTLFLAELGQIVQKKSNVSHADDRIAQILPLMNYRFAREIDLDQYAQAINLSRSRFCHLFKQTMGCSPHTYILDLRLEHAAEFLLSTDDPISQISYAVGFTDPFYFSRLFKKKFGISPKNFREQ